MPLPLPSDETSPARHVRAVTPHASNELTDGVCRALYIGGAGNVALIAEGDTSAVTFTGITAGTIIPVAAKAVRVTGTTATAILALY